MERFFFHLSVFAVDAQRLVVALRFIEPICYERGAECLTNIKPAEIAFD